MRFYVLAKRNIFLKKNIADSPIEKVAKEADLAATPEEADAFLVLGGDGTMLQSIRKYHQYQKPFYGFNFGHIGFLMNQVNTRAIKEILEGRTHKIKVNMLQSRVYNENDQLIDKKYVFNDFYIERTSPQTAKVKIGVNGIERFNPLICDGVIVCTSAGSTAYNASAGGVILPIGINSMVLTGISPYVYHNWRSSQLPEDSMVKMEAQETRKRPVRFLADGVEIPGASKVEISYSDKTVELGFANSQNFREKVLTIQFADTNTD